MTLRIQAKDVLNDVAPNVLDSGVCADTASGKAIVLNALDLAVEALMNRLDSSGTLWYWDVPTHSGCFALPEDCAQVRQVWVNGITATQRDEWYQGKIAWGLRDSGSCCEGPMIIDLGEFVIPQPLQKIRGIRLAFVAELPIDAGKEIVVEYNNEYGAVTRETLVLLPNNEPVKTDGVAYDVRFIGKPVTEGAVKLKLSFDNGQQLYFATYGPKTQSGSFRRKRLPRMFWGCNVVRIKGKRRYEKITSENDILPISNRRALAFACSAIAHMRGNRLTEYNAALAFAVNELAREMQDQDAPGNIAQMSFRSGFGCTGSQFTNSKNWN